MIIRNYKILYALLSLVFICAFLSYSFTLEDAQITYRYALRFSEGYPWATWNRNEVPIEGFTTILWMFIISLFGPDLNNIVHSSKIIGIISTLGLVILYYQLAIKSQANKLSFIDNSDTLKHSALFTAIFCAVSFPINWYSTSGMETTTYMLMVSAILFLPLLTKNIYIFGLLCITLVLIRPEGIAFAASASLYYGFKDKRYFYMLGLSLFVFSAVIVCRYLYFGHLMPNTYAAKSGGASINHLKYGVLYFGSFAISYWYIFAPFLLLPLLIKKKILTIQKELFYFLALMGVVFYFSIIAKSGGDNFSAFPHWRHGLILLPIIAFCSFFTLFSSKLSHKLSIAKVLCILHFILPLTLVFPSTQNFAKYYFETNFSWQNNILSNPMFLWLKKHNSPEITIATSLAGELPLTIDFNHIDVLGLNDAIVANEGSFDPNGPIDSKTKMDYVIARQPEIIEAYFPPHCVKQKDIDCLLKGRPKMAQELLSNSQFYQNYLLIINAPYESFNRSLFIRKDYYQDQAKSLGIEASIWSVTLP